MDERDLIAPGWISLGPHQHPNLEMFLPSPPQTPAGDCSPYQHPPSFCDFLEEWRINRRFHESQTALDSSSCSPYLPPRISDSVHHLLTSPRLKCITPVEIAQQGFDVQGIDWTAIGAERQAAQNLRKYSAALSLEDIGSPSVASVASNIKALEPLPDFHFQSLATTHIPLHPHYQLRSVFACPSQAAYFYASNSKVFRAVPTMPEPTVIFDVSIENKTYVPWDTKGLLTAVSTLAADTETIVVGGLGGDYAFQSLSASLDLPFQTGTFIPEKKEFAGHQDYINHVSVFRGRRNNIPQACLASNTDHLGILDCSINKIVGQHKMPWAPNATAMSPNLRMRLVVGDDPGPLVLDADTGRVITALPPHTQLGLSCAWAPDGIHLATGSQDKSVQIFDARRWEKPLLVLGTERSGASGLHFNPEGTGRTVLLAVEGFDLAHMVGVGGPHEGRMQTFPFFGHVSGSGFVETGMGEFVLAISDWKFGGLMEFERVHGLMSGKLPEHMNEKERRGEARAFSKMAGFGNLRF